MKEYQPYTDVMYLMTGYLVSDVDEERYPHFDIFMNENILFHTLEEADRKIAELAQDEELKDERACFFVYEVPFGVNCYPAQGQKIRSYTADGELNSESKVSALEDCNGTLELFPGREEAECRFKVGDKVAVFWVIISRLKRYMLFLLILLLSKHVFRMSQLPFFRTIQMIAM